MKKQILTSLLLLLLVLVWNTARAEFYVIPAGKRAKRTVLVSPKETQFASGMALLNALNGITDASSAKPYLIIIEPGIYDIQDQSLVMKSYVDIQGSGEGVTTITGTINFFTTNLGVVNGADNSELRFLTIRNQRTSGNAVAVCNRNIGSTMKMLHVTALVNNGSSGERMAVYNANSATTMTHVTALAKSIAHNTAIYNVYGAPVIRDSKIEASGGISCCGVYNYNSTVSIYNTNIRATGGTVNDYGIYNTGSYFTIKVHGSQIYGYNYSIYQNSTAVSHLGVCMLYKSNSTPGTGGIGTFDCAQCYDNGYNELNNLCQ